MMTPRDALLHAKWARDNALEEAAKACEGERTHHPHRDNRIQDATLTLAAEKIRSLKSGDAASPRSTEEK